MGNKKEMRSYSGELTSTPLGPSPICQLDRPSCFLQRRPRSTFDRYANVALCGLGEDDIVRIPAQSTQGVHAQHKGVTYQHPKLGLDVPK